MCPVLLPDSVLSELDRFLGAKSNEARALVMTISLH